MRIIQSVFFILFFIVPPVLFLPSVYEGYGIPKEIAVWCLLPLMLVPLVSGKNKIMLSTPIVSFGLFVMLNFVMLWTIPNKYYGVERLYILLTYFTILVAATNVPKDNKQLIMSGAMLGFLIVSSVGALQYLNVIHINWAQLHWEKGFGKRVFSTFGNPNALGSYLILFLPLSIMLALRNAAKKKPGQNNIIRIILFLMSFMGFACLLFTNSWGSLGGFAGAIIFIVVSCMKTKMKIWRQGLIALMVGFCMIIVAFTVNKKEKIFGEPTGAVARILLLDTAAQMFKDRPITGFGPSGFIYYSNSKYLNVLETKPVYNNLWRANPSFILRNPGYPENEYLNFLVDTGIVGFGLFIWFLISIFYSFKRQGNETDELSKIFLLGINAGIIALLVDGFFDIPFSEWYIVGAVFFALVGLGSEKREVKLPGAVLVSFVVIFSLVFFAKGIKTAISDMYFTRADNASFNKNNKLAIEEYQKSARFSILTHMVYSNMGKLAYEEEQYENAAKWYGQSIKLLPFHEALHYCLGGVYYRMGDFNRAESSFAYAVKLEPRYSAAYAKLASIYRKRQGYNKAEQVVLESTKYLPDDPALRNELGIIYAEKGDKKKALRTLEQALVLSKYDPVIWYNIYLLNTETPAFIDLVNFEFIVQTTGDKLTESKIRELLVSYPDYPDALLLYAQGMIKQGAEQEALKTLKKAISIAPVLYSRREGKIFETLLDKQNASKNVSNLFESASQCYAKKDLKGAEDNLLKTIETNPSFAAAYYNLGVLLVEKRDYENAILAWYKFIALNPGSKDIPNILAEIKKLSLKEQQSP